MTLDFLVDLLFEPLLPLTPSPDRFWRSPADEKQREELVEWLTINARWTARHRRLMAGYLSGPDTLDDPLCANRGPERLVESDVGEGAINYGTTGKRSSYSVPPSKMLPDERQVEALYRTASIADKACAAEFATYHQLREAARRPGPEHLRRLDAVYRAWARGELSMEAILRAAWKADAA